MLTRATVVQLRGWEACSSKWTMLVQQLGTLEVTLGTLLRD